MDAYPYDLGSVQEEAGRLGIDAWEALLAAKMPIPLKLFPQNDLDLPEKLQIDLISALILSLTNTELAKKAFDVLDIEDLKVHWEQTFYREIKEAKPESFEYWISNPGLVPDTSDDKRLYIASLLLMAPGLAEIARVTQSVLYNPSFSETIEVHSERVRILAEREWNLSSSLTEKSYILHTLKSYDIQDLLETYKGEFFLVIQEAIRQGNNFEEIRAIRHHFEWIDDEGELHLLFTAYVTELFICAITAGQFKEAFSVSKESDGYFYSDPDGRVFAASSFTEQLRAWRSVSFRKDGDSAIALSVSAEYMEDLYREMLELYPEQGSPERTAVISMILEAELALPH